MEGAEGGTGALGHFKMQQILLKRAVEIVWKEEEQKFKVLLLFIEERKLVRWRLL